jgi:threonine/homoserine/homoserine lactone efflux protein
MPLDLYLAFVAATVVLILIPGPNVALIVANSIAHGARYGLLTVAGTSAAMVIQLALTVLGMTALLAAMADWFEWLRWIGVAYLLWLGVQAWRAAPVDLTQARPQPRSRGAIWLRGFLVSMTNPKTLLFYGAFLPQFISAEASLTQQLILLSVTFLAIAILLDATWALLAARFRGVLAVDGRLRNRLTGGLLIGAGIGLALARRS